MMNEETKASLNKFLKEREERIKNMTLAEARDVVSRIYGHSDMRMESDKALQMLLDCADKALEQGDVLDKIRAEILDEAEYAYADFDRYKEDILYAEPDELPDDDFRYGMERAVEIINKYRKKDVE